MSFENNNAFALGLLFVYFWTKKKPKLNKTNNNNNKKLKKKRNLCELFNNQVKNVNQIDDFVTLVFVFLTPDSFDCFVS